MIFKVDPIRKLRKTQQHLAQAWKVNSGFPGGSDGKESACDAGDLGFNDWVRKILWRRKWQPTPVFLPREFHEQKSLVSYSPWSCKELGTTERLMDTQF